MKTISIYSRTIKERTGYRKFPYKDVTQVTIDYDGRTHSNHIVEIDNENIRVKFRLILQTRSKKALEAFLNGLGRSDADKWTKSEIAALIA